MGFMVQIDAPPRYIDSNDQGAVRVEREAYASRLALIEKPPPRSSLDTPETSVGESPALPGVDSSSRARSSTSNCVFKLPAKPYESIVGSPTGVGFRHSGWDHERGQIYEAFVNANVPVSRLERFVECGSHSWLLASADKPGTYKLACDRCHDRFCIPCSRERAREIADAVLGRIEGHGCRFVTLTLAPRKDDLSTTLDRLCVSFRRLRSSDLWHTCVLGGIAFTEIKRSDDDSFWHCHIHAIVEGKYLEVGHLTQAWQEATGDSYICDVRAIRSERSAAGYVAKYAGKGLHRSVLGRSEFLLEAIVSVSGRRLFTTFGSWYGLKLAVDESTTDWVAVISMSQLYSLAAEGDGNAMRLLAAAQAAHRRGCMTFEVEDGP